MLTDEGCSVEMERCAHAAGDDVTLDCCQLTLTGMPLLSLSNGKCHTYMQALGCWSVQPSTEANTSFYRSKSFYGGQYIPLQRPIHPSMEVNTSLYRGQYILPQRPIHPFTEANTSFHRDQYILPQRPIHPFTEANMSLYRGQYVHLQRPIHPYTETNTSLYRD